MLSFIKKISFFITSVGLLYVGPSMAFRPVVVKSMLKTLAEQWSQEAVKQKNMREAPLPVCTICLDDIYTPEVSVCCCDKQTHVFHKQCLEEHFRLLHQSGIARSCPLCRQIVPEDFAIFDVAVASCNYALVSEILHCGVAIDSRGKRGGTGLMTAACVGSIPMVDFLLSKGANINARDDDGNTAIMLAIVARQPGAQSMVRFLLERGADANLARKDGNNALIAAVLMNDQESMQILLDHGASINDRGPGGLTALMYATSNRDFPIIEYLIAHGADINIRDNRGGTLLMHAANRGLLPVVMLLLEHGVQLNICDNDGCTALSRAYQGGQPLLAHHLRLRGARMSKRDMICLAVRATMSL